MPRFHHPNLSSRFMLHLGVYPETTSSNDKTFDTSIVPSEENILTEALKGAITGNLPKLENGKREMSLAVKKLYDFYSDYPVGSYLKGIPDTKINHKLRKLA